MKIGVIDSGLSTEMILKRRIKIVKYARIEIAGDDNRRFLSTTEYSRREIMRHASRSVASSIIGDETGHGTRVIELISRFAPSSSFVVCKIFDDLKTTYDESFLAALRWMIRQRPRIINLSLGCFDLTKRNAFYDVALTAKRKNILICCAGYENPSLPAIIDSVTTIINEETFAQFPDIDPAVRKNIDFVVKDEALGEKIKTTSEACAVFTGLAANPKLQSRRPELVVPCHQ